MDGVHRRRFLSILSSIPIASEWMAALGWSQEETPQPTPEWEERFLAVETLRLINTLEKWNFSATGTHVRKEELPASKAYRKLAERSRIRTRFERVLGTFTSADNFEIAGYEIIVEPTADTSEYVAMVSMKKQNHSFAFVSSTEGVIYEGRPLERHTSGPEDVAKMIADAKALENSKKAASWWTGLFATIIGARLVSLLFTSFPQGDGLCACCTCEFPCPCGSGCTCLSDCPNQSTCIDSAEDYCCTNCGCSGCASCVWCRYSTCHVITDGCCSGCQGNCAKKGCCNCQCTT